MYTLISQYRGSYFPVTESARIEHQKAKEHLLSTSLNDDLKIMRYVRNNTKINVQQMKEDL